MKNALLLFVFGSISFSLSAQIIYTSNDLPQIGDTLHFAIDNGFSIPNLDQTGSGQTWDFSALYPNDVAQNIYFDPMVTPFAENFPDANIALRIDFDQPSYSYFQQSDEKIDLLGLTLYVDDQVGEQLARFDNPQRFSNIPTQLGTNFKDSSSFVIEESLGALDLVFQVTTYSEVVTDASGEILLPSGRYDVLRQKVITERRDSLFSLIFSQRILIEAQVTFDTLYQWISPASKGVILTTDSSGDVIYYAPDLADLQAPKADFNFTLLAHGPITFRDASQNTPFSWSWDFGDGTTSEEKNPIHSFDSTGTFNVCLTVENNAGSDQTCYPVAIIATSTEEFATRAQLSIFPNPADQEIHFNLKDWSIKANMKLSIFNQQGQLIKQLDFQQNQRLDTKDWPSGLYYYQLRQTGQTLSSGPFSILR